MILIDNIWYNEELDNDIVEAVKYFNYDLGNLLERKFFSYNEEIENLNIELNKVKDEYKI